MAQLPDETTTTVLNLQRKLLAIINQATATQFIIFEQYGETETTIIALDDLQNVQERADTYYSRFTPCCGGLQALNRLLMLLCWNCYIVQLMMQRLLLMP